jgi:toxin ParE1/3/4
MPAVTKRATARRDLIEHFVYLAENASVGIADRFLTNVEASFNDLAQQPMMGGTADPAASGLGGYAQVARQGF